MNGPESEQKMNDCGEDKPSEASEKKVRPKLKLPSRAEWTLGLIALAVVAGWIVAWSMGKFTLFSSVFAALSFLGALVMVAYISLKPFHLLSMPPRIERNLLPVVSLLPVLGYLIHILASLAEFLTIGGSIALAYCSAITYWRKQFLELAGKQLGAAAGETAATPKEDGDGGAESSSLAESEDEDDSENENEEAKHEHEEMA